MTANFISKRLGFGAFAASALLSAGLSTASAGDEDTLLGASFAVTATANQNTTNAAYCGGSPLAIIVEGHGVGYSTRLGPLSFYLQKTIDPPMPEGDGAMHGCLTLTDPQGDSLTLTYDGTQGTIDSNNFIPATGSLTATAGSGKFHRLLGQEIPFSASFYGGLLPTVSAYYLVQ